MKARKVQASLEITTDLPMALLRECRRIALYDEHGEYLGGVTLDQAPSVSVSQPVKPAPKRKGKR